MSLGHPLLVGADSFIVFQVENQCGLYPIQPHHITNLNSASYWAGRCLALYSTSLIIRRLWNHPDGLLAPVSGSSSLELDEEESVLLRLDIPAASRADADETASRVATAFGASFTNRDIVEN